MAKLDTLQDTFSSTLDTGKWDGSYGGVDTSAGQARVPVTTGYPALATTTTYDITNSYIFAKITTPTQPGNGTKEFYFEFNVDSNNRFMMFQSGSSDVIMRRRQAGTNSQTTLTYNAVTHAYWRLREASGTLYWDTSPDGITWTNRRSIAHSMTLTAGTVNVSAGYYGTESADYAYIDNVNTVPSTANTLAFMAMF